MTCTAKATSTAPGPHLPATCGACGRCKAGENFIGIPGHFCCHPWFLENERCPPVAPDEAPPAMCPLREDTTPCPNPACAPCSWCEGTGKLMQIKPGGWRAWRPNNEIDRGRWATPVWCPCCMGNGWVVRESDDA
jgi:hypothetical protein